MTAVQDEGRPHVHNVMEMNPDHPRCAQRGGNLSRDEIHVIQHALDMTSKTGLCPGAMTPLDKVRDSFAALTLLGRAILIMRQAWVPLRHQALSWPRACSMDVDRCPRIANFDCPESRRRAGYPHRSRRKHHKQSCRNSSKAQKPR